MFNTTNLEIAKLGEKVLRKKAKKVKDVSSKIWELVLKISQE